MLVTKTKARRNVSKAAQMIIFLLETISSLQTHETYTALPAASIIHITSINIKFVEINLILLPAKTNVWFYNQAKYIYYHNTLKLLY